MANTYTWDFPQIDTAPSENDLTDVAKTIHWRVTAVSDTETNDEGQPLSVSAFGTAGTGAVPRPGHKTFTKSSVKSFDKRKICGTLLDIETARKEVSMSRDATERGAGTI